MLNRRALDALLLDSTSKEFYSNLWKRNVDSQEVALRKNVSYTGTN